MEKVITNELTKFLIIIGAAVLALTVLMSRMISKVKELYKPYRKQTIIYLIIALLFFAIIALAASPSIISTPSSALIAFQAYFLLLGSAHLYFMRENLKWSGNPKVFYLELIYTLLIGCIGSIAFVFVYRQFNENGLEYAMIGSILLFVVPLLFFQTFRQAISIPPKVLKEWYYPINQEIEEPEDSKLRNLRVISFEFRKHANDPEITNFRAKAPADMEFGQLFYYFINDYNERDPHSKVQYTNSQGEAYGWIFYKKPKWNNFLTQYIDADKTINTNRIKENEVIICMRSVQ
ncbi:MAG: hypothetical protein H7Y27_09790 [Gemmatimonadaceae bacterium]|nr:hypothetical protein [Chitinophagaceae bacterium]